MWKNSSWRSSGCESSWPFHGVSGGSIQILFLPFHYLSPSRGKILFFAWHWLVLKLPFFWEDFDCHNKLNWDYRNYFLEGGSTLKLPWDWVVLKLPLRLFDNFKPDKPWLFAVPSPTWGKILDFLPFFEFNRRRVPRSQQLSWAKIQACVALTKNSQGIILTKVIYNIHIHAYLPTYVQAYKHWHTLHKHNIHNIQYFFPMHIWAEYETQRPLPERCLWSEIFQSQAMVTSSLIP